MIFPRRKAAVFVHGCFWHRHEGCNVATTPKTNTRFWTDKFERNVKRDIRNRASLEELGWRVFVVWECELSSGARARSTAEKLARQILDLSGGQPEVGAS
jgi:DNA mismatch endonuclease (patch repair protein)